MQELTAGNHQWNNLPITRSPTKSRIVPLRASEIKQISLEWLWYPFFPQGTLVSVVGAQSAGKTYLMLKLAADVANGMELPQETLWSDYQPFKEGRPVILIRNKKLHCWSC